LTLPRRGVNLTSFRDGASSSRSASSISSALIGKHSIAKDQSPRIRSSVRPPDNDHQKMDQTLRQLGELLLGAVPTVLLLSTLYILYTFLVHRPLTAVLAERSSRTQGAMEKARADIAAAEARTADYEQRLREARQKVFKNQEARRQQATQHRTQLVNEARNRAQEQAKQARATLEEDKQQAMAKLQSEAGRLAGEIVRAVLRPMASPTQVGGQ
jgi:F-type H+-transporting ATPase subunit b